MEALKDFMSVKKNEWQQLDHYEKIISMGKLKMLEELASYIECLRLSYTKELLVNGMPPTEDEKELKDLFEVKKIEKEKDKDKKEEEDKKEKIKEV